MRKLNLFPTCVVLPFALIAAVGCNREEPAFPGNAADPEPIPMTGPPICVEPGDCPPPDMAEPAPAPTDMASAWTPPPPGDTCGQQTFPMVVTRTKPNIHLVLDRSGSMSLDASGVVPTSSTTAKWEDLALTLNDLLDNYGDGANEWGMSLFPTTTDYHSCTAGTIAVPLGSPAAVIPSIKAEIGMYNRTNLLSYNGKTPTTAAMQGVIDTVVLDDASRNNYVVLMTDGMPNCAGTPETGVTPIIDALYAQTPPVRTFIIGFGSELVPDPVASQATNPALLNDWAVAGHTARAGVTQYYQASDVVALQAAFEEIVIGVAQCTFNLATAPADPSLVAGFINGVAIPADLVNGFSYDAGTLSVTFHGTSCMQIQSDPMADVQIVYGCPPEDGEAP
jgi:hypothetical protein